MLCCAVQVPLINVILPFAWKSFPFIFTADVAAVVGVYAWKVSAGATSQAATPPYQFPGRVEKHPQALFMSARFRHCCRQLAAPAGQARCDHLECR